MLELHRRLRLHLAPHTRLRYTTYLLKEESNREITPEEVVARFKQELRLAKFGSGETSASAEG